jgi:hypothetical protein
MKTISLTSDDDLTHQLMTVPLTSEDDPTLTSKDDPVGMVRRSLHKLNAGEVLPVAHGLLEESLRAEINESQKLLMGQFANIFCA